MDNPWLDTIQRQQGQQIHRAPELYQVTEAPVGDKITVQRINLDGTFKGTSFTLSAADTQLVGDTSLGARGIIVRLADGQSLFAGFGVVDSPDPGAGTPYTIAAGTDAAAQTDTWSRSSPPSGTVGVLVVAWFRLFWSGTVGDPVYQFRREATYDALGRLVAVGPEVRSTAFESGDCEVS